MVAVGGGLYAVPTRSAAGGSKRYAGTKEDPKGGMVDEAGKKEL